MLKTEGKVIEPSVVSSVNAYFITYFFLYAASVLIVSLDNFDFTSNFTAVAATLNNIGPGLGGSGTDLQLWRLFYFVQIGTDV